MRFLNQPLFRKLEDLRGGLYLKPQTYIDYEDILAWVQKRLSEQGNLVSPIENLLIKLTQSWGEPGTPGDENKILHIVSLIRDYLEQIIYFEEKIFFTNVPEEHKKFFRF